MRFKKIDRIIILCVKSSSNQVVYIYFKSFNSKYFFVKQVTTWVIDAHRQEIAMYSDQRIENNMFIFFIQVIEPCLLKQYVQGF